MNKKILGIASLVLAVLLPFSASAQYNSPHKFTDSFGKTKIYIPGAPDGTVDVLTKSSKEYTFTANTCGWVSIRESSTRKILGFSTSINSINVTNFNSPDVVHAHGPLCTYSTGWTFWEGQNNINLPNGTIWQIQGTRNFFVKIRPALESAGGIQGTLFYENTIKNKINSCGFGTITISATRPMATFRIAGLDYNLDTLPSVSKPQLCRIQNGAKVRYLPLN